MYYAVLSCIFNSYKAKSNQLYDAERKWSSKQEKDFDWYLVILPKYRSPSLIFVPFYHMGERPLASHWILGLKCHCRCVQIDRKF